MEQLVAPFAPLADSNATSEGIDRMLSSSEGAKGHESITLDSSSSGAVAERSGPSCPLPRDRHTRLALDKAIGLSAHGGLVTIAERPDRLVVMYRVDSALYANCIANHIEWATGDRPTEREVKAVQAAIREIAEKTGVHQPTAEGTL